MDKKPAIHASPLCHICLHHSFGGHFPGTVDPTTWQPLEIKLAADLGVGAARVRHVVAVERHHMAEDVCARSCVCGTKKKVMTFKVDLNDCYYLKQLFRYFFGRLRIQRELIIKIKENHKTLVVMLAPLTPGLPPHELQAAGGCKVLFDGVVDPLNEHAGQVGPLEHIGHGGAVTKRVDRPGTARSYTCDRGV